MTKADYFGHWAYFFLFVGMLLLQAKDYRGWAFRFAGEVGWIAIGFVLGLSSVVLWGFAFMAVDVLGYLKWQKEQEELALEETEDPGLEYVKRLKVVDDLDALMSEIGGPDCTKEKHQPFCRVYQKRPRPPAELLGALQDNVHTDIGVSRPAKSVKVKVKVNGKNKDKQRKSQGKAMAASRKHPSKKSIRPARRRRSK